MYGMFNIAHFLYYFIFYVIDNLVYKNKSKKNNTFDLFNASLRNKSTKKSY